MMSDKTKLVSLATKQQYVNETLVADLEHMLKLAKEGRVTLLAMMAYCAAEEGRWFSYIEKGGFVTVTDCFVFTESMSRQVQTMRNLADDIREEQEDR
jgi:hypothetical protein